MSAFVCSRNHIAALVKFQRDNDRYPDKDFDACQVANTLLRENLRSVNYRYDERHSLRQEFTRAEIDRAPDLTPASALKQCHCLHYQSCERPDYEKSEAWRLLKNIESTAMRAVPGYDEAPWGI